MASSYLVSFWTTLLAGLFELLRERERERQGQRRRGRHWRTGKGQRMDVFVYIKNNNANLFLLSYDCDTSLFNFGLIKIVSSDFFIYFTSVRIPHHFLVIL